LSGYRDTPAGGESAGSIVLLVRRVIVERRVPAVRGYFVGMLDGGPIDKQRLGFSDATIFRA
jgi:hypothetical protein